MGFKGPKHLNLPLALFFSVLIGFFAGIISSGLLNRPIKFFFTCVFIGSFISALATFVLFHFIVYKKFRTILEKNSLSYIRVLSLSVSTLMTFSFLSTVPLNVDRSFSVWSLNQLYNYEKPIDRKALLKEGESFFTVENGEISRRLGEQVRLGNVSEYRGKLELTRRGEIQAQFHVLVRKFFGLTQKYTSQGDRN